MTATPALGEGPDNPAVLSVELAALLPTGVAAAHLYQAASEGLLLAAEAPSTNHWSRKRWQDFTAGRVCARRALRQFELDDIPLRAGTDGLPIWPPGVTGCITHTNGYAAAVVGPLTRVRSLGVDSEVIAAVNEEVWPSICTPAEHQALYLETVQSREQRAALIFAAKEAFYKCQYLLTREWIEFGEVSVVIRGSLSLSGEFEIRPARALLIERQMPAPLCGRYRIHSPFITAVMAAPAIEANG
ncbi:MAG TPA: 4'-phosphopantetheinyl transferase superfamily protein [Steroidobacteraceae bacterium]|nr:4'-phosphopantetheinyl transferase superfamily protein [Steroidobacteraceae bacterium]